MRRHFIFYISTSATTPSRYFQWLQLVEIPAGRTALQVRTAQWKIADKMFCHVKHVSLNNDFGGNISALKGERLLVVPLTNRQQLF